MKWLLLLALTLTFGCHKKKVDPAPPQTAGTSDIGSSGGLFETPSAPDDSALQKKIADLQAQYAVLSDQLSKSADPNQQDLSKLAKAVATASPEALKEFLQSGAPGVVKGELAKTNQNDVPPFVANPSSQGAAITMILFGGVAFAGGLWKIKEVSFTSKLGLVFGLVAIVTAAQFLTNPNQESQGQLQSATLGAGVAALMLGLANLMHSAFNAAAQSLLPKLDQFKGLTGGKAPLKAELMTNQGWEEEKANEYIRTIFAMEEMSMMAIEGELKKWTKGAGPVANFAMTRLIPWQYQTVSEALQKEFETAPAKLEQAVEDWKHGPGNWGEEPTIRDIWWQIFESASPEDQAKVIKNGINRLNYDSDFFRKTGFIVFADALAQVRNQVIENLQATLPKVEAGKTDVFADIRALKAIPVPTVDNKMVLARRALGPVALATFGVSAIILSQTALNLSGAMPDTQATLEKIDKLIAAF